MMIKILLFLFPIISLAQIENNTCDKLSKLNKIIQELHYKPKPIDDSLSVFVFDNFLKELDQDKRLFTSIEIDNLKKAYTTIDNSILLKNCNFISTFFTSYNIATDRYIKTIEDFKKTPFEYKSIETIQFLNKAPSFAKDEKELIYFFKKRILFNVLKDVSEKSKNKDSLFVNFDKISKTSRDKVFEYYICQYSKLKISEKDFINKFLNIYCSYFDPHTTYLNETYISTFISSVSSDEHSFGMDVSLNDKDELIVNKVISGSDAYYSEKIESSDQIIKIKCLNQEFEVGCSTLNKIEEIFSSNMNKTAEFTFRKQNGTIFSIQLTKKIMKDHENSVFSYILKKENKKIGYIKIPSFYAIFENGKSNVSEDVAKEIYKLQNEKIEGLIIDLQNNGGGSMYEAIQLIGSFIDIGPITIMDKKSKEKEILKDYNRGNIYNGPMVVLINGLSASASELFANALQNYNRAIVVGNKSYGKASMQQIIPLTNDKKNDEFIKITIEKFYNINGNSIQGQGVIPDVEIPSLFQNQMPRENQDKTALKNDTIEGVLRFTKFNNPNKEKAINISKERVINNENLKKISNLNLKIDSVYDNDSPLITLNFSSVFDYINKMNNFWEEIKEIEKIKSNLDVERSKLDVEYQQYDEFLKAKNIDRTKEIKNNLHIEEGFLIINDIINIK